MRHLIVQCTHFALCPFIFIPWHARKPLMPQTLCMPNLMCSWVRSGFLQTLLFLEAPTATVNMALQPFSAQALMCANSARPARAKKKRDARKGHRA
ncbi:hypothetical protein [Burkholderia ubonensis]|uniref:hypothetical protein n=1 Tax=Burkholderia ubonensis TaxID=101571 RepID=UPI0012FBEF00|nr:hypothetical protein [Burkholderia ubonensis]